MSQQGKPIFLIFTLSKFWILREQGGGKSYGLGKICRKIDPKNKLYYQVPEQVTPGLDIGKGYP